MGASSIASIVMIPFPFSDLSASKLRPAVVLANAEKGDWTLCMVTSNPYTDAKAVKIVPRDFVWGELNRVSYVRPLKLFTAHESLMVRVVGQLRKESFDRILDAVVRSLRPLSA
jgi:mRNA interferase MazF